VIRPATARDVPRILSLIRELASFEREPDAVEATEAGLREVLFGADPKVFAHVAQDGDTVVGVAIWFLNFSTWTGRHGIYLEDLVVSADARRGGHGRALVAELARICVARGYQRLDWAVLDWNAEAQRFYRSLGAHPMQEWTGWRVTGDALRLVAGDSRPS
jgi:ribosomal protein S18 acetylase RimI-like enzyme